MSATRALSCTTRSINDTSVSPAQEKNHGNKSAARLRNMRPTLVGDVVRGSQRHDVRQKPAVVGGTRTEAEGGREEGVRDDRCGQETVGVCPRMSNTRRRARERGRTKGAKIEGDGALMNDYKRNRYIYREGDEGSE